MQNRAFWKLMMAGSVFGWLFIFSGILFPISDGVIRLAWWCVLLVWSIGHPLELAISLPIGREKGLTLQETILKTMVFGFTWWLPLKNQVIQK